jgi:quinol monooxygenase YgiN
MSSTQRQLTVFATFHIKPALINTWKEAHRPVWSACAAEPECLLFDVFEDTSVPGRFRLVEVWSKNREWFEKEQLTKPYYETLWKKSSPMWEKEVEIEYFERLGEGSSFREKYLEDANNMD